MNSGLITARLRLAVAAVLVALSIPVLAASPELLGAGDTIRVSVFQNSDLDTEARLSSGGTLLGAVAVQCAGAE